MTNDLGYAGKGHVLMKPNQPPEGGSCDITSYSSSITVGEALDISCVDWEDDNGIDGYKYFGKIFYFVSFKPYSTST